MNDDFAQANKHMSLILFSINSAFISIFVTIKRTYRYKQIHDYTNVKKTNKNKKKKQRLHS